MKSNLTRKELEAIQKKADQKINAAEHALKSLRHILHELEESFPGLKPLGGGGTGK